MGQGHGMPIGRRVEIKSEKRLFDDFFKIDEIIVSHQQYNGKMSADQRRLNFERGDAVGVMLFNIDTRSVVLVEQFKVPTLIGRRRGDPGTQDGWIIETMAGMIGPKETAAQAAIRETEEETGYEIENPELICTFLSSPGGTSERIFLYFAQVTDARRPGEGKGLGDEDIYTFELDVNELFDRLRNNKIEDPKLAIAAYWLQANMGRIETLEPETRRFRVKGKPHLIVGYKTGDIEHVKDMAVWVNPENSDMMMDRVIGTTISAKIRYLGANKDDDNNIVEDTIQESLRGTIGERARVRIGTVLMTESGMLRTTHQVKRIFHVAAGEGRLGEGVQTDPEQLGKCVKNVLNCIDRENKSFWPEIREKVLRRFPKLSWLPSWKSNLHSILLPMIGAGDGGVPIEIVAKKIIPAAITYLRTTPDTELKEIYFLAFKLRDKSACDRVFNGLCKDGILERLER
jgi:ADP-ribose pyrophosphatase